VRERLGQQGVAGLEVVVQQARRDAGGHGDAGHPRLVEAVAGDQSHRGVEDARPGILRHARNAIQRRSSPPPEYRLLGIAPLI
jgi:hypothetical protein